MKREREGAADSFDGKNVFDRPRKKARKMSKQKIQLVCNQRDVNKITNSKQTVRFTVTSLAAS